LVTVGSLSAAGASAAESFFHAPAAFAPAIDAPHALRLPPIQRKAPPSFRLPIASIPVLPLYSAELKGLKVRGRF
jgi:hypothetical protein